MLTDGCQRRISAAAVADSGRRHASVLLHDRVVGRLQVALSHDPLTMEELPDEHRNSLATQRHHPTDRQIKRTDPERAWLANEIASSLLSDANHRASSSPYDRLSTVFAYPPPINSFGHVFI